MQLEKQARARLQNQQTLHFVGFEARVQADSPESTAAATGGLPPLMFDCAFGSDAQVTSSNCGFSLDCYLAGPSILTSSATSPDQLGGFSIDFGGSVGGGYGV
jgi:hypothetical protein